MSETTVKESETTVTDTDDADADPQSSDGQPPGGGLAGWFGASALRVGLALVGFFLLLAALGQLSGIDLIAMGAEAIDTNVGRWLVVAAVAFVLIVAAVRGFGNRVPE